VDGCTSIIVGKGATVDGSVITSHSNDCQDCDNRMAYVPARDHAAGSRRKIYDAVWSQYPRLVDLNRSAQYHPGAGISESKVLGDIPQASHTYAIWESTYSLVNEKGLGMGESTCSANLVGTATEEPGDGGALFTVGNLMGVALERCETARCAIALMGDLAERYGFFGEDPGRGGAGEAVTIVDQAGEAWVFHISGGVPASDSSSKWQGQRGALWAAARVPDDHIAVVANNFIIRVIDPEDKDNFMMHPGLFELTQEAGLWDGEGLFDFLKIMAPDIKYFSYNALLPPIPMYTTMRQWWVFRSVSPGLGIEITDDARTYPFSVPVEKKISHLEMMDLFRTHYEGTQFDMTLGALAGPFQSPNRLEGGRGMMTFPGQYARSPSIPRTAYTQVSQTGGASEPAVWFAPDCSASSVFVPFFARTLLPEGAGKYDVAAYGEGSMKEFSFTAGTPPAWWAFDFVANWMDLSYKNMSQMYVYPKVQQLQREVSERAAAAVASANQKDGGAATLAEEQTRLQRHVTDEWWKFAAMLIVRYNDGFFNFGELAPQRVVPIGYPAFWLEMVGFDRESFFPTWFSRTPAVPQLLETQERAVAEFAADAAVKPLGAVEAAPVSAQAPMLATMAVPMSAAAAAVIFVAGVALGQSVGRRAAETEAARADYLKLSC